MTTYEVWRMVMYAVGVFVTCNAGGWALRAAGRRLINIPDKSASGDGNGHKRQTFEDIRRQIDGPEDAEKPKEA